ncbi:hypothetical protein [Methylobacterium oryzisoli]|uniref:hypothetical protein n=1 Tax=Methylobacterium oryzisoli TaxID=3385502 RepID=UPI003891DC1F
MNKDLLRTARRLATAPRGKPRQSDLKRSVSTSYYALFHAIAGECADRLIGTGPNVPRRAWLQTFRALDHGAAKRACGKLLAHGFPQDLVDVGRAFVPLQQQRHDADYDFFHRVSLQDAQAAISLAESAIDALRRATMSDRKAFAAIVLFTKR